MHNIKCSRCGRRAKYIDPFHPWENDYTVCELCIDLVKAERELRVKSHAVSPISGKVILPRSKPKTTDVLHPLAPRGKTVWISTILAWLKHLKQLISKPGS